MPTGDSRVIGRSRMTSRMASTASDGNDRLRKDRSLAIFRAVVAAKYTSSSSSSSSAAAAIHSPCEPLRPVVLLHDCRSFTSPTASGSEHPHQSTISSDHLLAVIYSITETETENEIYTLALTRTETKTEIISETETK